MCVGMWEGVEPLDGGDHMDVDFGGLVIDVDDFCGVWGICVWDHR